MEINLIKTIPPKQQEHIERWWFFNLIVVGIICVILCAVSCVFMLRTHATKNTIRGLLSDQLALKKQLSTQQLAHKRYQKLLAFKEKIDAPTYKFFHEILTHIAQSIPEDTWLEDIHMEYAKQILCTCTSRSYDSLQKFLEQCTLCPYAKTCCVQGITTQQDSLKRTITYKITMDLT